MNDSIKSYFNDAEKRELIYLRLCQLFLLFYVPLITRPANYLWVALLLFWLTEPGLRGRLKEAFRNRLFLVVVSLYGVHCLSLLWSADAYEGIKRLETRVALLFFPFLFATIQLGRATLVKLLKSFVVVCFGLGVVGLVNSLRLYLETGESVYLYSDNLLILVGGQAIYYALYLNVAILFILYLLRENHLVRWERLAAFFVFLPLFTVLIFLLAGRVSLAILALLLGAVTLILILQRRMYLVGSALVVVLIGGMVVMGIYFPKTVNRFQALTHVEFDYEAPAEIYHFNDENYQNKWNGLTIRVALWICTWDLIQERPLLGTGIGDYMDDLRGLYQERKFYLATQQDLSPHNQYLQIWLTVGVLGLIAFVCYLVYPALYAWREGNYLFLFFMLILALNMITEEVFAVYRGVVFFSFFHSLLLFQPQRYRRDTF